MTEHGSARQPRPSADPLRLGRILQTLAGLCQTDLGGVAAVKLGSCRTLPEAQERLDIVAEAVALLRDRQAPALTPVLQIEPALQHVGLGASLDGLDLYAIRRIANCAELVRRAPRSWPQAVLLLRQRVAHLPDLGLLSALLGDAIAEDGAILDSASRELARLRQEVLQLQQRLRRRMVELVKETDDAGHLQDDYFTLRDDRYVLPVKSSDKRVVAGIIHGSSQTGQTFYVEPQELVTGNNQLTLAMEAVRREERRILAELSAMCAEHADDLRMATDLLARLDVQLACGRLAELMQGNRPQLSDQPGAPLAIRKGRHPVLVLDGISVVANDVLLPPGARWLLISGPNGGGKTVVLSMLGLLAQLARRGLFVPAAPDTALPWLQDVIVVLGDAQDIDRGLSTFEGHLRAIQQAWESAHAATGPVLVLLDELASGTEPIAGNAMATAYLEGLAAGSGQAFGAVTTHFESLKLLPLRDPLFANAALALDTATLTPTYRLLVGQVGSSSPFVLAQRLGLAPSVVERAVQLAGGGGGQVADMLDKLQTLREGLEEDRREVQRSKHDVERSRQLLEDQRKNEKLSADRRIERAAATALAELQDLAKELEVTRQSLLHADRKQVEQLAKTVSDKQVRAQQVQLEASARLTGKPQRSGVTLADVLPGVLLWHTGLQRLVEVTEVQASSGRIRVRAGVLETACTLADLAGLLADERQRQQQTGKNPAKPTEPNRKPDRRAEPNPATSSGMAFATMPAPELPEESLHLRTAERTVDLRGQRVDAAVDLLDAFLDRAARQGAPGICVVHGMGTGAVRDAVRQHLKGHPHVGRFRTGERGEGGDGATLVWLKDD